MVGTVVSKSPSGVQALDQISSAMANPAQQRQVNEMARCQALAEYPDDEEQQAEYRAFLRVLVVQQVGEAL